MSKKPTPAWSKRWRLDRERGIKRLVPADEVRKHIVYLESVGMSRRGIAEAAGVTPSAISRIMLHNQKLVNRTTVTKVLRVKPEDIIARPNPEGFVPNIGARRRLRALMAIGHTADTIAAAAGVGPRDVYNAIHQPGAWLSRAKHDWIVTVYEELWNVPGPSVRTRGRAVKNGWLPPLAWDEDTIDDPTFEPDDQRRRELGKRRATDVVEDIAELLEHDPMALAEHIARRLSMSEDNVYKTLERAETPEASALHNQLIRNQELVSGQRGRKRQRKEPA